MIRSRVGRALSLALLAAAPCVARPVAVEAQGRGPDTDLPRQEMVERVEALFQERIARDLGLEPDQFDEFEEVLLAFSQSRAELLPRRRDVVQRIRRHVNENGSDDAALTLIEELRSIRARETELQVAEENRLLEVLRPSQVLRLQFLREQFKDEIDRLEGWDRPDPPAPRQRRRWGWLPDFGR